MGMASSGLQLIIFVEGGPDLGGKRPPPIVTLWGLIENCVCFSGGLVFGLPGLF